MTGPPKGGTRTIEPEKISALICPIDNVIH